MLYGVYHRGVSVFENRTPGFARANLKVQLEVCPWVAITEERLPSLAEMSGDRGCAMAAKMEWQRLHQVLARNLGDLQSFCIEKSYFSGTNLFCCASAISHYYVRMRRLLGFERRNKQDWHLDDFILK